MEQAWIFNITVNTNGEHLVELPTYTLLDPQLQKCTNQHFSNG